MPAVQAELIASTSMYLYLPELTPERHDDPTNTKSSKTEPLACRVVPETECLALDGSSACVMAIRSVVMILLFRTSV